MDLRKVNVKFMVEKGGEIPLGDLIPLFHRLIQEDLLEGMLVDVAEYTHVHQGPGVLLIAHECNYSIDEENGKRGLLYNQKKVGDGKPETHLKLALQRALKACLVLEGLPELQGKLAFAPGKLQVFVNDRLGGTSPSENHERLEKVLRPVLEGLYGGKLLLAPEMDPMRRTGFEVKAENPPALKELLDKLTS